MRRWNAANPGRAAGYVRNRRAREPEVLREYDRKRYHEDPTKFRARMALNEAVKKGIVDREPCDKCGAIAQAHHSDYSKPLEVEWLCEVHHGERHRSF